MPGIVKTLELDVGATKTKGLSAIELAIRDLRAMCEDGSTEDICFRAVIKYLTEDTNFNSSIAGIDRALKDYKKCHGVISAKINEAINARLDVSENIACVPDKINLFLASRREVRRTLKFFHDAYHMKCADGNTREEIISALMESCTKLRYDGLCSANSGDPKKSITEILKRFSGMKHEDINQLCREVLICFSTKRLVVIGDNNREQVADFDRVCVCYNIPQGTELAILGKELLVLGDISGTVTAESHNLLPNLPRLFVRGISRGGKAVGFGSVIVTGDNKGCIRVREQTGGSDVTLGGSNLGKIYMVHQENTVELGNAESSGGASTEAARSETTSSARACGKFSLNVMGSNAGIIRVAGNSAHKSDALIQGINVGKIFCDNTNLKVRGYSAMWFKGRGSGAKSATKSRGIFGSLSSWFAGLFKRPYANSAQGRRASSGLSGARPYIHAVRCNIEIAVNQLSGLLMCGEENTVELTGTGVPGIAYDVRNCRMFLRGSKICQNASAEIGRMCESSIKLEGGEISLPNSEIALSIVDLSGTSSLTTHKMSSCNAVLKDRSNIRVDGEMHLCRVLMLRGRSTHGTKWRARGSGARGLDVPVIRRGMVYVEQGEVSAHCMHDVHLVIGECGSVNTSYFKKGSVHIGGRLPLQHDKGSPNKQVRFAETVSCIQEIPVAGGARKFVYNTPLRKDKSVEGDMCITRFGCVEDAEVFAGDVPHRDVFLLTKEMKRCVLYIRQKGRISSGVLEECSGEIIGDGVELEAGTVLNSTVKLTGNSKLVVPESIKGSLVGVGSSSAILWLCDGNVTHGSVMGSAGNGLALGEFASRCTSGKWVPKSSRGLVIGRDTVLTAERGDFVGRSDTVRFYSVQQKLTSCGSAPSDFLRENACMESKKTDLGDSAANVVDIVQCAQEDMLCDASKHCCELSVSDLGILCAPLNNEGRFLDVARVAARNEERKTAPDTPQKDEGTGFANKGEAGTSGVAKGQRGERAGRAAAEVTEHPKECYETEPTRQQPNVASTSDANTSNCRSPSLRCSGSDERVKASRAHLTLPIGDRANTAAGMGMNIGRKRRLLAQCIADAGKTPSAGGTAVLPVISADSMGGIREVGSVEIHHEGGEDSNTGMLDAVNVSEVDGSKLIA
ncbi:hypothetical protein AOV_00805 [Anaplasma ovis str. Haibei]|uniref:Uncharacterized protein n=1 Tax=Anaplasma ovis str. Haibei TaxID=1248439 RepID=A0A2Z2LGY5_9RICK|nr:hypothetical protein [Anaplasma ovis]ASI48144.1 hypothetical protein AOV_00805 [Anaplasma ovis str. Haibei]